MKMNSIEQRIEDLENKYKRLCELENKKFIHWDEAQKRVFYDKKLVELAKYQKALRLKIEFLEDQKWIQELQKQHAKIKWQQRGLKIGK